MASTIPSDLISVLRRPDGLYAYRVGRRAPFDGAPVGEEVDLSALNPCKELVETLRPSDMPDVLASWNAMGRVRELDAEVLYHLLNVLFYTVPEDEAGNRPPPLNLEPAPSSFRPTAANPRAYKGTKDRPPKSKAPRVRDLRPHLTVARDVNMLLAKVAPFRAEASKHLGRDADIPPEHGLPAGFRRGFLYVRRTDPWPALALYRALELETNAPLRRCLERYLRLGSVECAELLLDVPKERRVAFAELLMEVQPAKRPNVDLLRRIDAAASDKTYRNWVHAFLRSEDPRDLVDGMELARDYAPKEDFDPRSTSSGIPVETIRTLASHADDRHLALTLWRECALGKGMTEILEELPWTRLPAKVTGELLYLFTRNPADIRKVLHEWAPTLFGLVFEAPAAYKAKAVQHLKRLLWYWEDAGELAWAIHLYEKFLPRLCRAPFLVDGFEDKVFVALTSLEDREWRKIQKASDDVLLKIERACRRDNDAQLNAGGIYYLRRHAGRRLARGLMEETGAVLKAARVLGGLGASVRREVIQSWLAHPLLREKLPLEDLVAAVPEALSDVVPRKVKRGMSTLSPGQRAWALGKLRRALPGLRWRLLSELCLERLGAGGKSQRVAHALRLYGNIDSNRRALRVFLREHLAGNEDYLWRHPLNRRWFLGPRRFRRFAWLNGLEMEGTLEDGRRLRLHIEEDPLEALRLGTYVGSCTGLGGSFAYSAAAVVLDVNKHVVYARNDAGKVVGRQLLAISTEEELVAYHVYPARAPDDLKCLFRDFDHEFARQLNIPIYDPDSDASGRVEPLLSRDWWDDGAWDVGERPE